ncbi:MAG TPA: class II fructose-bisphosphatase [Candidatus Nanoarchaeia archaeon]|nr:class II fructose-bisphosphatase [Candidatus Nanoarchaeia archaeon]
MDRNLALDFVRATEAAAISSALWVGKGNEKEADQAAVEAMRKAFSIIDMDGTIVIGEGERDEAPMLYIGEKVGSGKGMKLDIAIDPLEGTTITARGDSNAMSVFAAAPHGGLLNAPDTYMDKISVGPRCVGAIDLDASVEDNIKSVAEKLDKDIAEVTVMILDRDRHQDLIEKVRKCGCRIRLIRDGDIAGALAPAIRESGVDLLVGSGGAPEGVIAAVALKCFGGEIQGRLKFRNENEKERARKMGLKDLNQKLMMKDLVKSEEAMFAATGVTDGTILKGVRFTSHGAVTHSIVMRAKTKTIRFIEGHHHFEHIPEY